MTARFFAGSHKQDSNDASFESAFACASIFAALLLLIDTVIAVSIFVSADIATLLVGLGAAFLADLVLLRVLLKLLNLERSKPSAASV